MRILGLGDNTIDTYVDQGLQYPGGNAVNVAVMTRRLGAESHYLGCVGSDMGGELILSSLAAEGVGTEKSRRREGENARAFIGHREGDRYFIRSTKGVRAQYDFEADDFTFMSSFDAVHTSIYSEIEDVLPSIRPGKMLSFDFSNRWTPDYLDRVLPFCTAAFLSGSELSEDEAQNLLHRIAEAGPQIVVITRGAQPALARKGDTVAQQAALPTEVIDTLGAGDAFISGMLVASLQGQPLQEAMLAGATNAAQACREPGGFGHAAPWAAQ